MISANIKKYECLVEGDNESYYPIMLDILPKILSNSESNLNLSEF